MTRSEAIARIQRGLGFRSDLETEIISALQEAQRYLEKGRSLPRFLLQEDQTLALPSGSANVSLPTGFIREKRDEGLRYVNSTTQKTVTLEKLSLNIAVERFYGEDAGKPLAYVLRAEAITFYPERDTAYSLTWSYYKRSVSLATEVSNNEWLDEDTGAPEALIGRAGMIVAEDLGNAPALEKFAKMHAVSWAGMLADSILVDEEAQPLIVGGRL